MPRFKRLLVFYLTTFLDGLCLIIFPASSEIFKVSPQGISDGQYGVVFLPMITLAVATTVSFKALHRRMGAEKIFFMGLSAHLFFLFFLGAAYRTLQSGSDPFSFLAAANLSLGVGFGFLIASLNFLCVELYPERRDSVLSGLHASLGLGAALSPLAADFFSRGGSWLQTINAYAGLAFFCFVLSAVTRAARERALPDKTGFSVPVKSREKEPLPWGAKLFLVTLFFYGGVEATLGNWSGAYLTQNKGFSMTTAALALSAFWLFMTLGRVLATVLSLKMDARILYRISPFLMILSLLAILRNQSESQNVLFYMGAGFACSWFFPLSISLSTQAFDAWREQLSSLTVAALMAGVGAGSSLTGFLKDQAIMNLHEVFAALAVCSGIVAVFTLILASFPGVKGSFKEA